MRAKHCFPSTNESVEDWSQVGVQEGAEAAVCPPGLQSGAGPSLMCREDEDGSCGHASGDL